MKRLHLHLFVLVFIIMSCGGGVRYGDASKDEGSVEFGPYEVKRTVKKMVASMYDFLKNDYKKAAYIQVKKFRNMTEQHIEKSMITDEIATNLIKKRIRFIDANLTKDALKEMEQGMTGIIDPESAIPVGYLKSPNLFLSGNIREINRRVGSNRIQYLVITLKLVSLKTRVTMWQEQKEFLKTSSATKVSF